MPTLTSSTPITVRFERADALTAGDRIVYPEDFRVLTVDAAPTGAPLVITATDTATGHPETLIALAGEIIPVVTQDDPEATGGVREEYAPGDTATLAPTPVADIDKGQAYPTHLSTARAVIAKRAHALTSDFALVTTPATSAAPAVGDVDALPWPWNVRLGVIAPH